MVRSEYRKFCKVCKKELDSEKYFFQNHDTDPEYRWGYAKVLKNGTSFVRYGQEHLKMRRGVYVEIFPMDGIPEGPIEKKFYNFLRARYVTCLSFPDCWVKGEPGFKREYYLNTKRMLFEGEEINVPQKETELLVTLYGNDYMTPPPEKERGTHIPVSDFKL